MVRVLSLELLHHFIKRDVKQTPLPKFGCHKDLSTGSLISSVSEHSPGFLICDSIKLCCAGNSACPFYLLPSRKPYQNSTRKIHQLAFGGSH